MLCKRGLSRHAVSVRVFVTFENSVKTNRYMFKIILLPGSHIIVLTRDIDIANLVHKEWKLVRFTGK